MDILEHKGEKGNKILFILLGAAILISVGITFYNTVVVKNYQITAQVSCDPVTEKCFKTTCDPATDDACPKDPAQQTTYYKKISKKASTILLCEKTAGKLGCNEELSCTSGELSCSYTFCDPNSVDDGEQCSE